MNNKVLVCLLAVVGAFAATEATAAPVPGVEHIVVVGIDGMTASSVNRAKTPNMHDVMARGAYTLHGRSVDPSVSSPNWASIIMGSKPETHGITSNDWKPSDTSAVPTIFGLCHTAQPAADIAVVYEWLGFGRLFPKNDITFYASPLSRIWGQYIKDQSNAHAATQVAAARIREKKPLLTFIHLDLVDHAGHSEGYDTAKYDLEVGVADSHLGQIMQAIRDVGMEGTTVLFVVADHGGTGTGHGGKTDEEMTVPWMVAGPGIAQGREITEAVGVAQTAPTIAMLFGLTPPEKWTEKAVNQVLN
jgi:predicted AlkP superfamily pyrophosphatase or phosphodiesterase